MGHAIGYTLTERFWLAVLGVFGFLVVNGAFAYGLLFQPNALTDALTNPLAAAFIVEALVLVGVFAYLFQLWFRWFSAPVPDLTQSHGRCCGISY